MGTADRLIRILLAALFAALFYTGVITAGPLTTVLWIVGTIFLITSAIGFCPLYALFRVKTCR